MIINWKIKLLYFLMGYFLVVPLLVEASSNNYLAVSRRNPSLAFDISDRGADVNSASGASLHYQPKVPTIVGIESHWRGLSLSYSKALSRSESNEEQDFTDYSFGYYFDSIGIDALYSEFLGFRLQSAEKLDLSNLPRDEVFRKDFAIKTGNLNFYYFPIRLGWSLNRMMDLSQSEQSTGIGIGLVGSYNNLGISTQHGIIPQVYRSTFGKDGSLQKGSFSSTGLSAAVAGTLAIRPLFFSLMLTGGVGAQTQKYETEESSRIQEGRATRRSLAANLGIATQSYFLALQITNEAPLFTLKEMALEGSHSDASLKFGLKF